MILRKNKNKGLYKAWHSIVQAQRGWTSTIDKVKKGCTPKWISLASMWESTNKEWKKFTLYFPVETYQSLHKEWIIFTLLKGFGICNNNIPANIGNNGSTETIQRACSTKTMGLREYNTWYLLENNSRHLWICALARVVTAGGGWGLCHIMCVCEGSCER